MTDIENWLMDTKKQNRVDESAKMRLPVTFGTDKSGMGAAAFDLGERRNSPLLIAGAASEDAKLQCLKGLLSSLAAKRSADEAMAYAFGDDAGRLRQLPSLPLVQPVCPPLVRRQAEEQGRRLPRIENPCTDGELACRMIGTMLRLEMEMRLRLFAAAGTRDLERYNAKATDRPLPYIVIAVDGADESLDFPKSEFFGCMERVLALGGATGFRFVFVSRDADGTDSTAALIAALKLRSCAVLDLPPDTASSARTVPKITYFNVQDKEKGTTENGQQ